jgi:hypothetical protein
MPNCETDFLAISIQNNPKDKTPPPNIQSLPSGLYKIGGSRSIKFEIDDSGQLFTGATSGYDHPGLRAAIFTNPLLFMIFRDRGITTKPISTLLTPFVISTPEGDFQLDLPLNEGDLVQYPGPNGETLFAKPMLTKTGQTVTERLHLTTYGNGCRRLTIDDTQAGGAVIVRAPKPNQRNFKILPAILTRNLERQKEIFTRLFSKQG